MVRIGITLGFALVFGILWGLVGLLDWWQAGVIGFAFGVLIMWLVTDEVDDELW
jgi:membrane associated rhomboid family serine protease